MRSPMCKYICSGEASGVGEKGRSKLHAECKLYGYVCVDINNHFEIRRAVLVQFCFLLGQGSHRGDVLCLRKGGRFRVSVVCYHSM